MKLQSKEVRGSTYYMQQASDVVVDNLSLRKYAEKLQIFQRNDRRTPKRRSRRGCTSSLSAHVSPAPLGCRGHCWQQDRRWVVRWPSGSTVSCKRECRWPSQAAGGRVLGRVHGTDPTHGRAHPPHAPTQKPAKILGYRTLLLRDVRKKLPKDIF